MYNLIDAHPFLFYFITPLATFTFGFYIGRYSTKIEPIK